MRDPLSRSAASLHLSTDSWFLRVRENLRQLLSRRSFLPSSANGAALHLLRPETTRVGQAQGASLLTHALLIGTLAALANIGPGASHRPLPPGDRKAPGIRLTPSLLDSLRGDPSNQGTETAPATILSPPRREIFLPLLRFRS